MKNQQPIQRHELLVPYSKEHHFGLLLGWKIKQGLSKGVDPVRISNYVEFFFNENLNEHFLEEEKHLFPILAADDPMRLRAEAEHESIRTMLTAIANDKNDKTQLIRFAEQLDEHIRFEERVLFNHIQANFPENDLQLRSLHRSSEQKDADAGWTDVFWARDLSGL